MIVELNVALIAWKGILHKEDKLKWPWRHLRFVSNPSSKKFQRQICINVDTAKKAGSWKLGVKYLVTQLLSLSF